MIICSAIIKGGTGKTTTVAALAQAARTKKKKVLAIDLDPQANLSIFLGGDTEHAGSYEILHGGEIETSLQTTPQGIDLMTGNPDLATETTSGGSAKRLQAALAPIKQNYDFIFIDTPPLIGDLTYNAIQTSDSLLIPLEADNNSIKGLYQITAVANMIKERSAPQLSFLGVIITRFRPRAKINQFFMDAIRNAAETVKAPYLGEIRDGIAIREAQSLRKSLFEYAPKSNPAKDYMNLYKKIK